MSSPSRRPEHARARAGWRAAARRLRAATSRRARHTRATPICATSRRSAARRRRAARRACRARSSRASSRRLHGRGLSGRSLARMLSGWRAFYRFLLDRDTALKDNPCAGLKAPKSRRRSAFGAVARRGGAARRDRRRRRAWRYAIARCSSSPIPPACGCRSLRDSTVARSISAAARSASGAKAPRSGSCPSAAPRARRCGRGWSARDASRRTTAEALFVEPDRSAHRAAHHRAAARGLGASSGA